MSFPKQITNWRNAIIDNDIDLAYRFKNARARNSSFKKILKLDNSTKIKHPHDKKLLQIIIKRRQKKILLDEELLYLHSKQYLFKEMIKSFEDENDKLLNEIIKQKIENKTSENIDISLLIKEQQEQNKLLRQVLEETRKNNSSYSSRKDNEWQLVSKYRRRK